MTPEVWHTGVFLGLMLFSGLSVLTANSKNFLLFLAAGYFILSGITVFANPWYQPAFENLQVLINWQSALATVQFMLVTMVVWKWNGKLWPWVIGFIGFNCLAVLIFGHGVMHASSLDAALAVVVLPVALERWSARLPRLCAWALVATTVIIAGGVTGYAAGAVALVAFITYDCADEWIWGAGLTALIGALTYGVYYYFPGFFNSWGRVDEWQRFMTWWWDHAKHPTGTGLGTFELIGPMIQGKTTGVWFFMHNEYLQVLFETGIIGFGLAITVWGTAVVRSFYRPALFASMMAASVVLSTQFPLRFFLGQVLFCMLLKEGWEHENVDIGDSSEHLKRVPSLGEIY